MRNGRREINVQLEAALGSGEAIRLTCSSAGRSFRQTGFVVGVGKSLALIHCVAMEPFVLNGYACIRKRAIRRIDEVGATDQFLGRALLLRGLEPVTPTRVDLRSMRLLLLSIAERYSVISCWVQEREQTRCISGRILRVGSRKLLFREMNGQAEWSHTERFPLRKITEVDFGGGYEQALQLVNKAYNETLLAVTPGVGTA